MASLIEQFFPLVLLGVPGGVVYLVGRVASPGSQAEKLDVTVFATALSFLVNIVVLGILAGMGRPVGGFDGLNSAIFAGAPVPVFTWLAVTLFVAALYGFLVARYDLQPLRERLQSGRSVVRDASSPWVIFGNRNEYVLVYTTTDQVFMGELSSWEASGPLRELVLKYPYEYVDSGPKPLYPSQTDSARSDERVELFLTSDVVARVVGIPSPASVKRQAETAVSTPSPTEATTPH